VTADQIEDVCVDDCYSSLEAARSVIAAACTLDTDIIVVENVAYPATFIVDNYLFTYELSCRKDSTTGEYCDPLVASWANQSLNTSQLCSDCWLGGLALQLNSPFGYDSVVAVNYASLTSSCNATTYTYATPTQYALNATAISEPATVTTTPASSCIDSYKVQVEDTCNSVAQALNVSTYSLLYLNNLDLYCLNWASTAVNRVYISYHNVIPTCGRRPTPVTVWSVACPMSLFRNSWPGTLTSMLCARTPSIILTMWFASGEFNPWFFSCPLSTRPRYANYDPNV
jgi:hypothetical protein